MRIKVSGELGTVVMSLAVIGLYYGAASFLIENVILRNLTEEERLSLIHISEPTRRS